MKNELIKYKVKNDIIFSYIFSKEEEDDYLDSEPLKGLEVHFIDLERFRSSNPNLDDKLNQWLAFVDTENG